MKESESLTKKLDFESSYNYNYPSIDFAQLRGRVLG